MLNSTITFSRGKSTYNRYFSGFIFAGGLFSGNFWETELPSNFFNQ
jgi:hypothetical protein